MFDQDPRQLAVAGIDVVRPFDAGVDPEGGEGVGQRQRHGLREPELLARGQERRAEHDRKEEVDPLGTRPRVAPLSAAAVCRSAQITSPWPYCAPWARSLVEVVSAMRWIIGHTATPKSRSASLSEVFLSVDSLRRPMMSAQATLYSPAGNFLA